MKDISISCRESKSLLVHSISLHYPKRTLFCVCALLLFCIGLTIGWPQSAAEAAHDKGLNASDARAQQTPTISTIAGGGYGSSVPAKQAPLTLPIAVALDPQGRGAYIIDDRSGVQLLRFLNTSASPVTLAGATIQSGHIGLVAGGGGEVTDGTPAREADLAQVTGMVIDPSGNAVFLNVSAIATIYAINVSEQPFIFQERTIQPGTIAGVAKVNPDDSRGLALNTTNNNFYFISGAAEASRVFKVAVGGDPTVVAGGGNPPAGSNGDGGPATEAKLTGAVGLVFNSEGHLLIAEGGTARSKGAVRKVANNIISSIASELDYPVNIAIAPNGNAYVPLGNAQRIIRITPGGSVSPIVGDASGAACKIDQTPTCGDGGPALSAKLNLPGSASGALIQLAASNDGLFLPDYLYPHVRFVNFTSGPLTIADVTIASEAIDSIIGNGKNVPYDNLTATYSELNLPHGLAADAQGNLIIADTNNKRLRFVNRGTTDLTLFAGTPSAQTVSAGHIISLNNKIGDPVEDDRISTAFFESIQGLTSTNNGIYICDAQSAIRFPNTIGAPKSGFVRFLNTSNSTVTIFPSGQGGETGQEPIEVPPGQIKIIAGLRPAAGLNPENIGDGGPASKAVIFPADVAVDNAGNIYIADYHSNRIRRIDAGTGIINTLYGNGEATTLNKPTGLAFDEAGRLLIADTFNNRILRQNTPGGAEFSIIADNSLNPPLNQPRDLTVTSNGKIYLTNTGTNQILELTAPSGNGLGTTSVLAGTGTAGFVGDGGPAADAKLRLANVTSTTINQVTDGIVVLPNGAIAFVDTNNNRIRQIATEAPVGAVVSVSAASFASNNELAAESIVAAFGNNLATGFEAAQEIPLPTTLLGTTVEVQDSGGVKRLAPLFAVSAGQVNYQIPSGSATGEATVTVHSGDGHVSIGTIQIVNSAPGLFTTTADGRGVPAAQILRIRDGQQIFEPLPQPLDLGNANEQVYLILYGTGIRHNTGLSGINLKLGDRNIPILAAGAQGTFVGLDQINAGPIPRELIGAGRVNLVLTVDGKTANTLSLEIR